MNTTVLDAKRYILLTFDVEDWFQVENFKSYIEFSTWNSFELRVEKNTHLILDLLDYFSVKPKATFFVLGWIARKLPGLVKEIQKRGHEVASHGSDHHLCTQIDSNQLKSDLTQSRNLLEDIIGEPVLGYRAPSFAVNNDILKIIKDAGYSYDSSYNSFAAHGRYGTIDLSGAEEKNGIYQIDPAYYEMPVSNMSIMGKIFPLGGGGYFRLIPFLLFKLGMKAVLKNQDMFLFYSHPWEFDPDQPRMKEAARGFKFRHYVNLNRTAKKLKALITVFGEHDFITCSDYINKVVPSLG